MRKLWKRTCLACKVKIFSAGYTVYLDGDYRWGIEFVFFCLEFEKGVLYLSIMLYNIYLSVTVSLLL